LYPLSPLLPLPFLRGEGWGEGFRAGVRVSGERNLKVRF
jgi:hypothetical protein